MRKGDGSLTNGADPGPLVTYAQNREDLFLWALVGHRTPGTYVDVGCNHERLHSVTRLFYDRGWRGVNIDANPKMEPEYGCRTRDQFVLAGVGETSGDLVFREYPLHDGLSTFDDRVKDIHAISGYPFVDTSIAVRRLTDILGEFGVTEVDFLKVDVEGMEASVLRGLDLQKIRPAVIVVESTNVDDCTAVLAPHDYRIEFFDGLNTYFVDGSIDDVTIHNYAARVLMAGFRIDGYEPVRPRMTFAEARRRARGTASHWWAEARSLVGRAPSH